MNFEFLTLAKDAASSATQTTSGSETGSSSGSFITMIVIYALIFGALYFFMIRPQKKKKKEEQKMRENLQVGDEVVTIGGIQGRIVSLKEDTMVIESQVDHSKLTFARWALQTNLTVHDAPASK